MEITDKIRQAGNRGTFYPSTCGEIENYITVFNKNLGDFSQNKFYNKKPKAIISPHAGYVYSGFTANMAHRILANGKPETIVVIGPSHHVYIEGVSAAFTEYYETPCGMIETDLKLLKKLNSRFDFEYNKTAHYKEHSTETQMPFIAHYNPQASVIELVYGRTGYGFVSEIIEEVLNYENTAVVISSDLSHFYPLSTAEKLDAVCIEGVKSKRVDFLEKGCEACGITGIEAMIEAANKLNLESGILDYRTSADASGDTSRVVGYMSAIFW